MIFKCITILWLIFITIASIIPVSMNSIGVSDKFIHFIIYYITTFFCTLTIKEKNLNSIFKISILIFLFSIFIEIVQCLIPYRSFSVEDIYANGTGIYLFIVSFFICSKIINCL